MKATYLRPSRASSSSAFGSWGRRAQRGVTEARKMLGPGLVSTGLCLDASVCANCCKVPCHGQASSSDGSQTGSQAGCLCDLPANDWLVDSHIFFSFSLAGKAGGAGGGQQQESASVEGAGKAEGSWGLCWPVTNRGLSCWRFNRPLQPSKTASLRGHHLEFALLTSHPQREGETSRA